MKIFKIAAIIFFLFLTSITQANLTDVIKSTVMIQNKEGRTGTGIVFDEDVEYIYILTAGHIIAGDTKVSIKCSNSGRECHVVGGEVLGQVYTPGTYEDLAVCRFEKKDLLTYPFPKISHLAPEDYKIKVGDNMCTAGHASGEWASGYLGRIDETDDGSRFIFTPPPVPGRSGSGVFDEDGKLLIGITIWKNGACVPVSKIHKYLREWKLERLIHKEEDK